MGHYAESAQLSTTYLFFVFTFHYTTKNIYLQVKVTNKDL